jgi:hypothetical protein
MSDVGGLVRFRPADPFRVGIAAWLALGGFSPSRVGPVEPAVGAVEPVVGAVEPVVGAVEPVVGGVEPVVGGVEPGGVDPGGDVVEVGHMERSMVSLISVTAPPIASKRPCTATPLLTLMEWFASTLPSNAVVLPSVAELPICQ